MFLARYEASHMAYANYLCIDCSLELSFPSSSDSLLFCVSCKMAFHYHVISRDWMAYVAHLGGFTWPCSKESQEVSGKGYGTFNILFLTSYRYGLQVHSQV